ncbi:MAG: tetratricopeptide repeat protein [Planctomycetota bacterium]
MKPLVFVSSVSREFKTARQLIANTLLALGYEPIWQDIFETAGEDIRPMLRKKIDQCSAVLQIVGDAYGAEPPAPDETFGRISYTQYEAQYARTKGKKVYYLIAGTDMPRDAFVAEIDLPHEDTEDGHEDANERRRLQSDYRASVQSTEHIFYPIHSHPEAELSIRRLRQDLNKLRQGFRNWMIGVSAALVMIAIGIGIIQFRQQSERQKQAQERIAQQEERIKQQQERQAAKEARQQAQRVIDVHRAQANRFLQILIADKDISPESARQRAIKELPALVDLPLEEVAAIIDQKLPLSGPDEMVSPLDRARSALSQGNYDDVFAAADADRAEGRELAMLEGSAALAKFRLSPIPEWNQRAVTAFDHAMALSEKDSKEWADAAISASSVLHDLFQYSESERLLMAAMKIVEREHGKASPEMATVKNSLAILFLDTNRLSEAELLLRHALSVDEDSFGPKHTNVARDLNNLAQVLKPTSRLSEAEPLLRRSLTIDQDLYGPEHPEIAARLNNVADLLHETNRLSEAESLYRRAISIGENSLGPEHPEVGVCLNNLARLLQDTNRLSEAEPLYRRALSIDENSFGPEHPKLAIDLGNLALLLKDTNRLSEAEPLLRRTQLINEDSFGPNHPNAARDLNNLAQFLKATNRLSKAEPLLRRCCGILENPGGDPHANYAGALNNLALFLQDSNRYSEAEPLYRLALSINLDSLGPEHPNVASGLSNLALLLSETNRPSEAEPLYRRALSIDEESYGPDHPSVARDLNNLAGLLQDSNRLEEAEPLMRRALSIFSMGLVEGHPATMTVQENYRRLLKKVLEREDEIEGRIKQTMESTGPLAPFVPEVVRVLGPALSVSDVLTRLNKQYKAEGKPAIYFVSPKEPIGPYLAELSTPTSAELNAAGTRAYRRGFYASAIVNYDEGLKSLGENPDDEAVFSLRMNRAAATRQLGKIDQARDELRALLLELDQEDSVSPLSKGRAYFHLALCEWRQKDVEAAKNSANLSLMAYGEDAKATALKQQTVELLTRLKNNKPPQALREVDSDAFLARARDKFDARIDLAKLSLDKPVAPLLDRLLGKAKPTGDVLANLDRQYMAEGRPKVYFLPQNEPIAPHLNKLLGPADSTEKVFAKLDRQYRKQGKPDVWFLPDDEPIAPYLDELLGPVTRDIE